MKHSKSLPSTKSAGKPFDFEAKELPLDRLLLDPNNYRFLDRKKFKRKAVNRFHEESVQRATLEILEQNYQLDDLKQSILTNGYVPMERIIVVPYESKAGHFVVVEGNRRVAALKSLVKDDKEGASPKGQSGRVVPSKIPCAVLRSGGSSLKHAERVIMGIRHIAGPKEWGAYQRAVLVKELKDEEGQDFSAIGEMLGISSVEASRRYRAINALQCMEADDLFSKKAEPAFYHLFHELVALPGVRERFGWSQEQNTFNEKEKAREFFSLICGEGAHDAKLQTYSDVRKLKSIVGNSKAEEALFDPEVLFSEAYGIGDQVKTPTDALQLLSDARNSLKSIAFDQVSSLTSDSITVIDNLLDLLKNLRKVVVAK